MRAVIVLAFVTAGACAQTPAVINYSPTIKAAVLGTTECRFWLVGSTPGSEIAVYLSGVLQVPSVLHLVTPANGTNIFPCPAPLDRFQIAVSSTGGITASIVPLPPPPPQTYQTVFVEGTADGVQMKFVIPTKPLTQLLQLSINGLIQAPGSYAWDGNETLTFTAAPPAGAVILVLYR